MLILCLFIILSPTLARSQNTLTISKVGFGGYYSFSALTPVRVHLPAVSQSQSVKLELTVRSGYSPNGQGLVREDRFTKQVNQETGRPLEVDLPIFIPQATWGELNVTESAADGRIIDHANQELKSQFSLTSGQFVVAVYCTDEFKCRDAEFQLSYGNNEKGNVVRNGNLHVVTFREPEKNWWSYTPARAVVFAAPISGLSSGERQAIENYLRCGGVLILVEDEIADSDFLTAYRHDPPKQDAILVGRGHLYRLQNLASKQLAQLFSTSPLARLGLLFDSVYMSSPLLGRTGISFTFPRLRWLITWLAIYLVVVGPLNFFLLRRMKRLEWGWITVCILAAVFAIGFFLFGSARRPRNYTLDNATVYWMDSRSPISVANVGLRVSAPQRGDVSISLGQEDLVVSPSALRPGNSSDVDIGAMMTDKIRTELGWDVRVGPPIAVTWPMLRWSTQDFNFEGFHTFSGTVHWISPRRLKNDSGLTFREAIYLDYPENKQYLFSYVADGQEIDLATSASTRIYLSNRTAGDPVRNLTWAGSGGNKSGGRFSVAEIPYSTFQIGGYGPPFPVFAGLSDAPVPDVQVQVPATHRSQLALTLVYMDEK
ncbi:MAG: hypothetical protein WB630_08545 [Candidatus Acidiferrales bacterium]